jgi:hypothetical protein
MYESRTSRGAGIGNAGRTTALTVAIAFLLWLALPDSHAHLLGTGRTGASQLCTDWMVERDEFEPSYMDPAPVASRSID